MYKKSTKEAIKLRTALEKLGIRVLSEVGDGFKHVDLALPDSRINIEVDGPKHLTDAYQIIADMKRAHGSDDMGYDTVHIPNELIDKELGAIASALAEAAKIREEHLRPKGDNTSGTLA